MNYFPKFFFNFPLYYLRPLVNLVSSTKPEAVCIKTQKHSKELLNKPLYDDEDILKVSRVEINMVMGRLGMTTDYHSDEEKFGSKEFSEVFEGNEPSLEEVKEAFDVFNKKKDGFIDAKEMQRVLCCLGMKEGLEEENCRNMIMAADENGDGLIDFHEFVKLMEKSFC